ncbi:MAG: 50S ribosomal protein L10 [Candidatus Omnitrophota bacterium]
MGKLGRIYRKTIEEDFSRRLSDARSMFMVGYSGLKSAELVELRNNISRAQGRLFVSKNSLAARVLRNNKFDQLAEGIKGQTAFIFSYDDPISVCKQISLFIKEHNALEFQAGVVDKRLVAKSDLGRLAEMPSRDELRAKVAYCLKAPLNNLVFALSGVLKKPIYALKAIIDKKDKK